MTTVVDATLLVAALVDAGREGRWARAMLADSEPVAPELVLAETSNVLRRLEQRGAISEFQASVAHRDLLRLQMKTFPFAPLAARVWALRRNVTAYDAWYVALAEAVGRPLATLDGKLRRAAGPACGFLYPTEEGT